MKLSIASSSLSLLLLLTPSPCWARVGRNLKKDDKSVEEDTTDAEDGTMQTAPINLSGAMEEGEEVTYSGFPQDLPCEPSPEKAREFIAAYGQQELGSMECFANPVNGCSGGCCRLGGPYFQCDTDGSSPNLPCVCNDVTGPPPAVADPVVVTNPNMNDESPMVTDNDNAATTTAPPLPNIVDTAVTAGSFNTLVDLVATAELVDVLTSPGPFTVFAPTDEAFPSGAALEEFKNATSLMDLTSILTYHVVPGRILSSDLVNGTEVTTVQGNNITVGLYPNATMINDAMVVAADVLTSNGVIHVIDTILMPPPAVSISKASTTTHEEGPF